MTSSVQQYVAQEHPILRAVENLPQWCATTTHAEALATIISTVEYQKGYGCIFGEHGSGKTAVLNAYANHAWRGYVRAVLIDAGSGGYIEFVRSILEALRIDTTHKDSRWLRRRLQLSAQLHLANGKPLALLIDNAQALDDEVLSQMHLLIDSSAGQESVLQIVLAGTAELDRRLLTATLAPVNQRLTARYVLTPLESEERIQFIHTLFRRDSMPPGYGLPQRTLRRIARKAKGNPAALVALTHDALRRVESKPRPSIHRAGAERQPT